MLRTVLIFTISLLLSGCFLTKVVTVPMRLTGAVISIIPVVGNSIDESIDTAADSVDLLPL